MKPLSPHAKYSGPEGPVVLVIMDGVGIGHGDEGDMVAAASSTISSLLLLIIPMVSCKPETVSL